MANISIHALLAESDDTESAQDRPKEKFLSTLSLRRATTTRKKKINPASHFYPRSPCGERHQDFDASRPKNNISIHALLAESDLKTP